MINRESLGEQVVSAIFNTVGPPPIALHEPSFHGNELIYLEECIQTGFVSSVGQFVDRFERDLADFTGAKHAIAVMNGTAALHLALRLAGVEAGDEVLIPALTFVATANAVTYTNATPHFVDSEERTLGLDACKLRDYLIYKTEQRGALCVNRETGRVIRAVVPMHTFGHPIDIDSLLAVAHDFNLVVVEDAAESLGSLYCGKHTGTFGLIGTLSFNGNKTITTGGGGAILTNNSEIAIRAKHLSTTAKVKHSWEYFHDQIGYNYRLPNINAALGCAQLEQLPSMLEAKRTLFSRYMTVFSGIPGISLFSEPDKCESNYWLQALLLNRDRADDQASILKATNAVNYMTRPVWSLMQDLPQFINCPKMDLSMAVSLSKRLINIPSSSSLILAA